MKFHPILLVGVLALSCHAAPASAEDALIRKVIVRTGIVENVRTQMRRQMEATRAAHPELPVQTWKKVELEIQSTQMEDEMVQVWRKSFTVAELTEIDKFMSTETGKKFFQTSQVLVSRTAAVAALTGVRIYGVLQKEHPDKFPQDLKSEDQVRKVFESMKHGASAGGASR